MGRWQGCEHAGRFYVEVFARASRQCDLAKASALAKVAIPSVGLAWPGLVRSMLASPNFIEV
jgi:hypothetical protein